MFSSPLTIAEPPPVYDYRNLSVKQLVTKLALPESSATPAEDEDKDKAPASEHPRVIAAQEELLKRGAKVVPQLVHYLDDSRLSRQGDDTSLTVGERVRRMITELMKPAVKLPAAPAPLHSDRQPDFAMYYNEVGLDAYNRWAWRSTPQQQELAYVRWYIESTRGLFAHSSNGDKVEQHLAPYIARANMLEQVGVRTSGPLGKIEKRDGPTEH